MTNQIFSATGCMRCKITKEYMQAGGIEYEEFDIKAEGKDTFAKFYRANRKKIFRDEHGVEFPVFTDGNVIRQGVSVIIAYLSAQSRLDNFIKRSKLHGEWLDGIHISSGSPEDGAALIKVMSHLKAYGLKIEITSDGTNPDLLDRILENGLADRVIMEISSPIENDDLTHSIASAVKFSEYRFFSTINPLIRPDGSIDFITPEEVGEIARIIEQTTGSKKHPYALKAWNASEDNDERLKSIDPLPDSALFKYRTMARRYMVMTEIQK